MSHLNFTGTRNLGHVANYQAPVASGQQHAPNGVLGAVQNVGEVFGPQINANHNGLADRSEERR